MFPEKKTLAEMKAELADLCEKLQRFKVVKEENRRLKQELARLVELEDRWKQATGRHREKDRNQERYQEPAGNVNDLVTVMDWKGRFLYLNQRSRELFGFSPDQGLGLSAFDLVHPDDRDRTREWFARQVNAGQDCGEIENRQVGPSGAVRYLVWTFRFHYDETGELTQVSSLGRDITAREEG